MTVGESICLHRKKQGLSQEELGNRLLVSRQTVSLWEKNKTLPTIDNLLRLKEIFGISIDEILCASESAGNKSPNSVSIDSICATLAYAMGISPPKRAAEKNAELSGYIDRALMGKRADRIVMFNPDAIPQWIYEKYPEYFAGVKARANIEISLAAAMPSITPVCLASMYSGLGPEEHGIKKYEKPALTVETVFDSFIAAGKRVALISYKQCSLGRLFLGRDIDYYHFERGGISEANAKACELIMRDEHDVIVVYNGNYDYWMHRTGPESPRSLSEIRANDYTFSLLCDLIESRWGMHNTLLGFAMDHGCHEIEGGCGSHGLDTVEDRNIIQLYKIIPKREG